MQTTIGKIEDLDYIKNSLEHYQIREEVLVSLINNASTLILHDDKGNRIGCISGAISLNSSATGSLYSVIGIHLDTLDYTPKKGIIILLNMLFCEVVYSEDVMKYIEVDIVTKTKKGNWFSVALEYAKETSKTFIDGSIFSYLFTKDFIHIEKNAKLLDNADKCRISFLDQEFQDNLALISSVKHLGSGIYTFPLFSKSFCKNLLKTAAKYPYSVNEQENAEYQMNELIIDDYDSNAYNKLRSIFEAKLLPLIKCFHFTNDLEVKSIQLAKYNKDSIGEGNWHIDRDSTNTIVVSLSDDFTGGGTVIKPYADEPEIVIPKLPVGHAILFNGNMFYHKGLPVTSGTRDILVYWNQTKN